MATLILHGGPALDAVIEAVGCMEADADAFNAGVGSSLARDGTVECDACVMDGRDGNAGAVALADGRIAWAFDTPRMALAWRSSEGEHAAVALDPGVTVRP